MCADNTNGFWGAVGNVFSKVPAHELSFLIISLLIIMTIPEVFKSSNNENINLALVVVLGFFLMLFLCIYGIITRKPLYDYQYSVPPQKGHLRKPKRKRPSIERQEIEKAFKGEI